MQFAEMQKEEEKLQDEELLKIRLAEDRKV